MTQSTTRNRFPVRHVDIQEDAGQRIDNFLKRELKKVPQSRVYRMLRRGEVRVNGGRVKPTYRLRSGDSVRIPPVFIDETARVGNLPDAVLTRIERAIFFEDEHLLVLDKPAGMAVHGGSGVSFGVIEALRKLRPAETLQLVHRLDRDTSGCLMIAKSRAVLLELHQALRERQVRKRYAALVFGTWPKRLRTVRLPLHRYIVASGERRVRVASEGKPSRTDVQVVAQGEQATWINAHLHTGRTHQIRVHTFASGHGVIGDDKYALPENRELAERLEIRRLCLHAERINLPFRDNTLRFECPIPEEFLSIWEVLGGHS
ncbi:MAG: RluA family pseudouridine synthase [Gammaproteobacteria bacterium]|nr:RluA family pseudouridine synthase [Gammaproteobacteria bacterium]